ncbi:hypothetical protein P7C73_g4814, partial [Tremellales sp. Uapishka_1]
MSSEKLPTPPAIGPYLDAAASLFHPVTAPFANSVNKFHGWKESMGLIQPGTTENLTREVNQTLLTNYFFEGARADLTKAVSMSPAFQVSHAFALGSATKPANYSFGAIFANAQTLLQGGVDNSGNVTMRANQTWSGNDLTKIQGQVSLGRILHLAEGLTLGQFSQTAGHSMLQLEHDHLGPHYSLNLKTINPSPTDLTGIHMVSFLHSFSPRLAAGFETVIQHPQPNILEASTSWLAKLTSLPSFTPISVDPSLPAPFEPSWTATAQLQPSGNIQATYYQRLSDKVDVALDLQTIIQGPSMMGPAKREALATVGAKYDMRMSTFRGQVDSSGKVGMLLEQRFTPAFAFLVGGEIDHAKDTSRIGVGIMIESSTMTPEEMMAAGMIAPA